LSRHQANRELREVAQFPSNKNNSLLPSAEEKVESKEAVAAVNEESSSTVKFLVDLFLKLNEELRKSVITDEVKVQKKKRKNDEGTEHNEDEKETKLKKKFKGFKCFKCHGYGHKSMQCPTRDWDDEDEEKKVDVEKGNETQ